MTVLKLTMKTNVPPEYEVTRIKIIWKASRWHGRWQAKHQRTGDLTTIVSPAAREHAIYTGIGTLE